MPSPSSHSLLANGGSSGKLSSGIGPESAVDGVMHKQVKAEAGLPPTALGGKANGAVSPSGDPHASNGVARVNGGKTANGSGSNGVPSAGPSSLRLETNGHGVKEGSAEPEGDDERPGRAMSEVARGKARQIDIDLQSIPREELEAEVRPETEGLVPMGAIVARLANYGFESFQNLADTLPSLPSNKRRARIFETALEVRKQMIKLLVLVRWSKCAPDLQRARNLITLICDQYGQTEDAVNALTDARRNLAHAGMRNADLATAIDVLGTGTSHRLPSSIKDALVPPRPFSDVEAAALVDELNEAIRIRLACDEVVPAPLSDYGIDDGRATFKVPGLFEAAVTLSGDADEDRWWLMALTFDFQIAGSGKDVFPRSPKKRTRMQLLAMADAELMPRSPAAAVEGATVEPITNTELPSTPLPPQPAEPGEESGIALAVSAEPDVRRDAPLLRLFNCLQCSALNYQLEILHFQALQLARQNWGQSLIVRRDIARRTLTIEYWRNKDEGAKAGAATGANAAKAPAWDPTAGGSIRVSVQPVKARESAVNKTLARLLLGGSNADPGRAEAVNPQVERLGAAWECRAADVAGKEERELGLSPQHLDIEETLTAVVRRHASAALRACREAILRSPLSHRLSAHDCKVLKTATPEGPSEVLLLPLHERARLTLRVDVFSGRLRLENDSGAGPVAVAVLASSAAAARLREASRTVSREPSKLVEALQRLLVSTLIEDVERKLTYLGLACLRRMPLRQGDYATLDAAPASLLYLPLVQCPAYYLVFHVGGIRPRVALVCAGAFLEGATTVMGIQSVEWLDRDRIAAAASSSLKRKRDDAASPALPSVEERSSFSAPELRRLHSYSVALVCYHKIEQQLRARGLPFVHISGARRSPLSDAAKAPASPSEEGVSTLVPSLCVRSWPMLGPAHALVRPNISIRLRDWLDEGRCRVEIALKMRMSLGRFERTPPSEGTDDLDVDPESNVLLFSTHSIDECIARFQHCWSRVTKVAMLAREVAARSSSHRKRYPGLRLQTFDLGSICFDFSEGLRAIVRWEDQAGTIRGGRYVVAFAWAAEQGDDAAAPTGDRGKPPHDLLRAGLQRSLNLCDESTPAMWPAFIRYLYDVTPIVRICAPLSKQALEDASSPEVEVLSATHLRLLFANGAQLDVSLLQGSKILIKASRQSTTATRRDIALHGADEAPDAKQLAAMARGIVAALPKPEPVASDDVSSKAKAKSGSKSSGSSFMPRALALGDAIICDSAEQMAGKALQGFVDALGPKKKQSSVDGASDAKAGDVPASASQAPPRAEQGPQEGKDSEMTAKDAEPSSSDAQALPADAPAQAAPSS